MLKTVKAFSLIELMVVIAIVALLSAVAVPAYKGYMRNAKIASVLPIIGYYQQLYWEKLTKDGSFPTSVTSIGLVEGSSPEQTVFPASADDYVAPYLALVSISGNLPVSPGCPILSVTSYISNMGDGGVFGPDGTPYLQMAVTSFESADGMINTVCGFFDVTTSSGPDAATNISNCYNLFNSSESDAYNVLINQYQNAC